MTDATDPSPADDAAPRSARTMAREMADMAPRLVLFLVRLGATLAEAEDVVQTGCLKVAAAKRKKKAAANQTRQGFYFAVARSEWLNARRARVRRREQIREPTEAEEPAVSSRHGADRRLEAHHDEATTYDRIRRLVAGDDEAIAVLELARQHVSAPSEVAERLGWDPKRVVNAQERVRYAASPLLAKKKGTKP